MPFFDCFDILQEIEHMLINSLHASGVGGLKAYITWGRFQSILQ